MSKLRLVVPVAAVLLLLCLVWGGSGCRPERASAPQLPAAVPTHPDASPKNDSQYLNLVAAFPPSGRAFVGVCVLYFSEPLVVPKNNHGVAKPPLSIEPVELAVETDVKDNYIIVGLSAKNEKGFLDKIRGAQILLDPGLKGVSGKGLNPDTGPLYFPCRPLAKELSVESLSITDKALSCSLLTPLSASLLDKYYTRTVTDAKGAPLAVELQGVQPGSARMTVLAPLASAFPVKLTYTRNTTPAGEIGQYLPSELATLLPNGPAVTIDQTSWRKASDGRQSLRLWLTHPLFLKGLKDRVKLTRSDSHQPVGFNLGTVDEETASVRLVLDPQSLGDAVKLDVELAPLLLGPEGAHVAAPLSKTVEPGTSVSQQAALGEKHLRIHSTDWEGEGVEGPRLTIRTNASMNEKTVRDALTVEPEPANLAVKASGEHIDLCADWVSGQRYQVSLASGLTSADEERVLQEDFTTITEAAPKVSAMRVCLDGKKFYIPRKKMGPIPMEARNKTEGSVELSRVFPSNIAAALYGLLHGEEHHYYDDDDGELKPLDTERYSESLGSQDVTFPDVPDSTQRGVLDTAALFPKDKRGVFTLACEGTETLVLWTDIGLVSHFTNSELVVFAHDLETLKPIVSATATVYSKKLQVMATATTDDTGAVRFRDLDAARFGDPFAVVVRTAADLSFLLLEKQEGDSAPFTDDMPSFDPDGYDGYVYLDRNLYRPGETVHARWIVRTGQAEAAAEVPLLFEVKAPGDRLLQSTPVTLSELGTGGLDIKTEKPFQTGVYTVTLRVPGSDADVGSAIFNLEEFVPNRMKATVTADRALWKPGEAVGIALKAENLYGGPAAGRRTEAVVTLSPGAYKADKWPDFSFTNDDEQEPVIEKLGQQQSDDQGGAAFEYTYTARNGVTSPLKATVHGFVFELGGREVHATTEAFVFPAPVALGLSVAPGADKASVDVSVAAITPDQAPAGLNTAKVALEEEQWVHNVRRYGDHDEPWYIKEFKLVEDRDVTLQDGLGKTQFHLDRSWGRYRIRVHSAETPLFSTVLVNSRWNRVETEQIADKPELVELRLNKKRYNIGESCELHIRSPFDGVAFIAVQGDHFQQTFVQPVTKGEGTVSFKVSEGQFPNVWVEVTVVRSPDGDKSHTYPHSSFAMVNVPVNDEQKRITVTYPDLPVEVRPAQKVEITLETRDKEGHPVAAELSLAAVDEGIHSILDYENPDPFTWFQRSRQPDFSRAHYYDKVNYDFVPAAIGGDALAKRLGASAQIGENWIKPVALWSGSVTTDASGRATIQLDVPEFNGQLRLVAVAVNKSATGTATAPLYVRRPYILQTSIPRFALPGDQFGCGATVTNTTAAACNAVVRWRSEGTLSGHGEKQVELPPGKDAHVAADFTAAAMGQGTISWELDVLNPADGKVLEHLAQSAPLPVRPPAAWRTEHELAVVQPGETKTFKNALFLEDDSVTLHLTATANPLYRLQRNLAFLLHYPYGCAEQTTSTCLPLYLIGKNPRIMLGLKELPENADPAKVVASKLQAGVSRLFSMQTPSGGFSYWPGGTEPNVYCSVYAAHFLTMAFKDNAAVIPEKAFRSLQDYLRGVMKSEREENGTDSVSPDLYTRAYACYVLCLDGQLDAIQYLARFENLSVPENARWLLAAALAINSADPEKARNYLDAASNESVEEAEPSGTLNSEVSNTAVRLLSAMQMGLPQERVVPLADELIDWVNTHQRQDMTTHDAAFVFLSLGHYLGLTAKNTAQASATITAPDGEQSLSALKVYNGQAAGAGKAFQVQNTGQAPVFVNFISEGVPAQPRTEPVSENGLAISRAFFSDKGTPVEPGGPFSQGGMYLVDLKLALKEDREHLVLSDLLPAGLEIANPRLDANTMTLMGRGKAKSSKDAADQDDDGNGESERRDSKNVGVTPSFLEVRDDRLVLAFDKLEAGEHHFYYAVRAVSPGSFRQPAAVSECMCDPTVRAATVDTTVKVE